MVAEYFKVPKGERAKGLRVTVSCSTFVPKPHTPFQWAAQDTIPVINEKQEHLREVLKIKGVTFNWHAPYLSFLEACFSRGDRRIGRVLKRAFERGCMLDGWNDQFTFDEWMAAFSDCGLDPSFYANRERRKDELLPWDFLDCGVTKEFLWREKEKSERAETTRDCRKGCNGCGIQRFKGLCAYADPKRANAPSPSLVPYGSEEPGCAGSCPAEHVFAAGADKSPDRSLSSSVSPGGCPEDSSFAVGADQGQTEPEGAEC